MEKWCQLVEFSSICRGDGEDRQIKKDTGSIGEAIIEELP